MLSLSKANVEGTMELLMKRLEPDFDGIRDIVIRYPSILCYSKSNISAKIDFFEEEVGIARGALGE